MKINARSFMYRHPVTSFGLILALWGALSQPISAAQKVIVADDFTLDGKDRVAGLTLDGVAVKSGRSYWKVPAIFDNTAFTDGGAISNRDTIAERAVQGVIPINDPSDPITVQADVVTESAGWVSVGILANDSVTWFDGRNLLFALIEHYQELASGTEHVDRISGGRCEGVYVAPIVISGKQIKRRLGTPDQTTGQASSSRLQSQGFQARPRIESNNLCNGSATLAGPTRPPT